MRRLVISIAVSAFIALILANAGRFLVIDRPSPADVIVVLAGETDKRPALGIHLLQQGLARHLVFDVSADAKFFESSELDLAQRYIQTLPDARSITVCAIHGLSTKAEAQDASRCLKDVNAKHVLIVTSDYHTRRALSTFKKEVPAYDYSVAAAYDPQQFGMQWWRHREWAKNLFYEWIRLAWWEAIDRW